MKTRTKATIITVPVAVVAFLLSPILFPPAEVGAGPTSAQIPLLVLLGVGDAVLLGLGVSFLVFGYPVPPGTPHGHPHGHPHGMCSEAAGVRVDWQMRPAPRTEGFFESVWGLAQDGETDQSGRPGLLQAAVIAQAYADEFRLVWPPERSKSRTGKDPAPCRAAR